jgi:hypothetical protein
MDRVTWAFLKLIPIDRGMDVKDKHDYVHIPDPGEGIYVYVIDSGVNIDVESVSAWLGDQDGKR